MSMEFRHVKLDDGTRVGIYIDSSVSDEVAKKMIEQRSKQLQQTKPTPKADPDYMGFTDSQGKPIA